MSTASFSISSGWCGADRIETVWAGAAVVAAHLSRSIDAHLPDEKHLTSSFNSKCARMFGWALPVDWDGDVVRIANTTACKRVLVGSANASDTYSTSYMFARVVFDVRICIYLHRSRCESIITACLRISWRSRNTWKHNAHKHADILVKSIYRKRLLYDPKPLTLLLLFFRLLHMQAWMST